MIQASNMAIFDIYIRFLGLKPSLTIIPNGESFLNPIARWLETFFAKMQGHDEVVM